MTTILIFLSVITFIASPIAVISTYIAYQLRKNLISQWVHNFNAFFGDKDRDRVTAWEYSAKPPVMGMRNIVIRNPSGKPFMMQIGFLWKAKGICYYGSAYSDSSGILTISTFLGKSHCIFTFRCNIDVSDMFISNTEEDQNLIPMVVYPPNWWQRLGLV